MRNMWKRLLACALALAMATTLLPMSVFAATTEQPSQTQKSTVSTANNANPVINKGVNEGGTEITMEAYVTDKLVASNKPLDIVLVLDVSGSMKEDITQAQYQYTKASNTEWSYNNVKNGDYYFYDAENGIYSKVSAKYSSFFGIVYAYYLEKDGEQLGNDGSGKNDILYRGELYTRIKTGETKGQRIEVLKKAVNGFINKVAADAESKNVTHRIGIVKFAGNKNNEIGNGYYNNNEYNYTQVVKKLTSISDKNDIIAAVNGLNHGGATAADFGLEMAENLLKDSTSEKVVIMFTDGEPNHGNGFNKKVATDTVNTAEQMKKHGVTIFTVGILLSQSDPDISNYMNGVSSNYPNARAQYDEGGLFEADSWTLTKGSNTTTGYYTNSATADDLNKALDQIAEMVSTLDLDIGKSTVLSDTLSDYFVLDGVTAGDTSKIKVEVVGVNSETGDWNGNGTPASGVTVAVDGKTVSVTGFDYKENAVKRDANGNYVGSKLVVTIPIQPDTSYDGWANGTLYYPTNSVLNEQQAGLTGYKTSDGEDASTLLEESPNVPLEAHKVTYTWTDKPDGVTLPAESKNLLVGTEFTADTYYNSTSTVTIGKDTYTFSGWSTSDVTLGTDNEFQMPKKDVTLSGEWTKTTAPDPTYKVSYTWMGLPEGTTDPALPNGAQNLNANDTYELDKTFDSTSTAKVGDDTYYFSGWESAKYGETPLTISSDGKITMPASDVVISGTWTKQVDATYSLSDKIYKTLTLADDATLTDEQNLKFEVTVTPKQPTTGNTIKGTATITKDNYTNPVAFDFQNSTLTFNAAGTYTYTVQEVIPENKGNIAYDTSTYTLTIEVKKEGTNLVASATATKDGAATPATEGSDAEATPATDKLITFTNTLNKPTPAPTTGTLTITKALATDNGELTALQNAADKKLFSFTVTGTNGSVTKSVVYGESTNNSVTFEKLPAGEYTITENYYPQNLGYNASGEKLGLFDYSFDKVTFQQGDSQESSPSSLKVTVSAGGATTVTATNHYTYWESGFGKHASALNGTTSDITLTLPKGFIQQLVVVNSVSEVPTIYAELVDEIGSGTVNVGGKDYTYDFAFVTDAEISLELDPQIKVVAQKSRPAENGSIPYTFSMDGVKFAELVYYPENSDTDHPQEHFTLFIFNGTYFTESAVKLHYQVKLDPNGLTTKGTTYGTLNEYGKDTTKDSALLTNNSAILYNMDNEPVIEYPLPTVSYTVSGGNGGGGGHSRPTLNTEDHYGYVIGYPDGTVQPGGSITRAEVATIFFRMLTDSSRTEFWSQTNSFSDVPSTAWFNNAVSTLTKAGIIAGYEDGAFQPNATITRAEFATIAVRFFEASYDGKDFFTDIDGHWAQQYINDAANAGLVNGYEDGTFGPNKAITRAEAMTLVNRALDRHPDADHFLKDMITWPDNSDTTAWYYEAVQEATNSHEYTMKTNTDKTKYEDWTKLLKMRDWKAFEAAWSNANSASNPGEVMGK